MTKKPGSPRATPQPTRPKRQRTYKPGESTQRVRAMRERRREEQVIQESGVTASPEQVKEAAAAIASAKGAARSTADQTATLGDAFGAGMAAALFRTILDGHTEREDELRDWLARPQPCRWMFLHYLTQQGIYGEFRDWSGITSAVGD